MRRGDIVMVALSGDCGEPSPAVVIWRIIDRGLPSVTVLPLTSVQEDSQLIRIDVAPTKRNGLHLPSQIMVDKIDTIPLAGVGSRIGRLDPATLSEADRALARFLGAD